MTMRRRAPTLSQAKAGVTRAQEAKARAVLFLRKAQASIRKFTPDERRLLSKLDSGRAITISSSGSTGLKGGALDAARDLARAGLVGMSKPVRGKRTLLITAAGEVALQRVVDRRERLLAKADKAQERRFSRGDFG